MDHFGLYFFDWFDFRIFIRDQLVIKKKAKKKKKSKLQKRKDDSKSGYWKKRADALWGKVIHAKYDYCDLYTSTEVQEVSPCAGIPEAHHVISRGNTSTRHSIENGILLCKKHHKFCNKISAHTAPVAFSDWLMKNRPAQYNFVQEHKYAISIPDYKTAYDILEAWLRDNSPHLL